MIDIPLEFLAIKMAEAHAHGASAERASIVFWLREQSETNDGWIPDLVRAADAIERGAHSAHRSPS